MSDKVHASMLLKMSTKDLKALSGMLDKDIFDDEIFGFHAQQAVEKGLKALLSLRDVSYRKIHDLEELFSMVEEAGKCLPPEHRALADLSEFAVQFRYESMEENDADLDRPQIIKSITHFLTYIGNSIQGKT
jgi:HEPN domain-containing protein